ncbi:YSIRK-type signal peptide-containing protein [Staphylococcus pseudintermedius]|uniref:MSCRAMM family adhesin SpsD n=1 Tax=Staphylococcus pseudintermedius TaxID=283734 RepID=UPI001036833F|nr:MSCRAMM family adhesin SpsD [Staphylococcus pseudintermedius]TBR34049.1 YSIRK-type signal peptide-containing protein [Staphylococcus pseudintermedius]
MITNKNIYSIRKHKLGVASFLLGTLFVVGHANNAEASEVSTTTQKQNVEKEQAKTEGELTTEVAQQAVSESAPIVENMQETTSVASENAKAITAPDSTQEVTKTEAKDTATMKDSEIAQPVSEVNKPVTQTAAPVAEPSTANKQTSPRQVQEVTSPVDTKVINVENGTDVTSKVKVETSSITGHQNNDKTYHQSNTVNPHKAERVTLNYEWTFENGIKAGDYFDFQLSDNVDTNGISTIKKVPHIMDSQNSEQIIAYGEINENNRVRYRFMDYVNQKENLKGKLALNLFIKPDKVQTAGNITVSSKLGNQVTSQNFNIQYIDGVKSASGITLNGRLDELSKADQSFTHYATFNPNNNKLTSVSIVGTVINGSRQNGNPGEVKVYEFIGSGNLPQSVYANINDTQQFNDITSKVSISNNKSVGYQINFDMEGKHSYVIVYKGHYDSNAKDFSFRTNATGYQNINQPTGHLYFGYGNSFNLTWDNGVAFYSNNASGEGNDKPVPPTYGYSPTVNTIQDTHADYPVMTFQQPGTLEETEDSMPITTLTESGEDRSENTSPIIETTEDSQPVEFEEETNHGIQDVTLHADAVDFEEETNHGEQDTVHHSDVVEYDEDTTTGMLTGAISDHTTKEDTMEYTTDSLLIEFDDEMNPNVSGQYDDITTDTIEESSHIDTFTELESEFGQHDGIVTFEEDTIVEKPKTEKGNRVPLVIDLSTPKHNHQFNIQPTDPNIDTSATYRIGNFVWRDEDHNGVQNDGEHGLEGVLVTLKTADGVVLNTTTSDANGHYQFTNVQKGKYIVEFTTPEGYEATSKHTTANTEKDSDGLIANIDVTQDDMSIDAGFFPLENWNPQPEPKNPDDKEKPGPEQPDVPQPEPKNPDDREKPGPEQPDVPQPEPKNPDDREKPAPEQPDVPQPEPKNPDDREKPAPEQPDVPQPEPKNPDDKEKPAPEQPDVPQPEPKNPDDKEKPAPEQPDVPQPEPKNPDDKEKPAPEQPDAPQPKPMLPGEKVKPKPTHPGEAMQTTPQDKSTSQTDEALPKTGESSSQSSALIFGGLLSLLGLGLLRRSSKQNRSSMK